MENFIINESTINYMEVFIMTPEERLKKIQSEGIFTRSLPFEQFVSDLCKRYTRIFGEILPQNNYEYIVSKLEEKGILDEDN